MITRIFSFWKYGRDFQSRVRLITLFCSLIPLIGIGTAVIWKYSNSSMDSLRYRIEIESQIIRENVTSSLLFNDMASARDILSTTVADPSIISVSLLSDEMEEILTQEGNSPPNNISNIFSIEDPIYFSDKIIGYLHIKVSTQEKVNQVRSISIFLVISLIVILAAMPIVFAPIVRSLLNPLITLYDTAKNIAKTKNYSQRVDVTTDDEIGRLSNMFNRMVGQIEQRDEMLEKQVAQRTFELEKLAEEFRFRAFHDSLTGLPNRALLNERFQFCIEHAGRTSSRFAVLLIDLDDFKTINDSKGHEFGDELLIEVGDRLKLSVRTEDFVCRLGGDEFVILIGDIENANQAEQVVVKIIAQLSKDIVIRNDKIRTAASIGVSLYPDHGNTVSEIKRHADVAMYKAKNLGKNQFCFFSEGMQESAKFRLMIQNDLNESIEKKHFEVYIQPKVNILSKTVVGCEALVRWHHPKEGFLTPDKFIPYAEEIGLINEIDYFVLKSCCETLKDWALVLDEAIPIAVNLSGRHFHDFRLVEKISEYLTQFDIDPSLIEVEITEAVLIEDPEKAKKVVQAVKELGVSISLDDFGTGYSSLSYLRTLPIDTVKLDRSFVSNIDTNAQDRRLTKGIVSLTNGLNLHLIAEGVENASQLSTLSELGCYIMQGYYFLKPVPSGEFIQWYIRRYSMPKLRRVK